MQSILAATRSTSPSEKRVKGGEEAAYYPGYLQPPKQQALAQLMAQSAQPELHAPQQQPYSYAPSYAPPPYGYQPPPPQQRSGGDVLSTVQYFVDELKGKNKTLQVSQGSCQCVDLPCLLAAAYDLPCFAALQVVESALEAKERELQVWHQLFCQQCADTPSCALL